MKNVEFCTSAAIISASNGSHVALSQHMLQADGQTKNSVWHTNPHLVSRTSDDGRKDGAWSVVAGESGFAHSRPVVDHQRRDFVIHLACHVHKLTLRSSSNSVKITNGVLLRPAKTKREKN